MHGNTKVVDIVGDVVDGSEVISCDHVPDNKGHNKWIYTVKCSCGIVFKVPKNRFEGGKTQCNSCSRHEDLTGSSYGLLTVTDLSHKDSKGSVWNCVCKCGNTTALYARLLPAHKSCGCLQKSSQIKSEAVTTHGMSTTAIYERWNSMKSRATCETALRAEDYVLRGIGVDDRWLSFEKFYEDMGDHPTEHHTLERIRNNEGYSKANCKWETRPRQQSNRRVSHNTSGRIGVSVCPTTGKWRVRLSVDKIDMWLGRFEDFGKACEVIEDVELKLLGYSRSEGFFK